MLQQFPYVNSINKLITFISYTWYIYIHIETYWCGHKLKCSLSFMVSAQNFNEYLLKWVLVLYIFLLVVMVFRQRGSVSLHKKRFHIKQHVEELKWCTQEQSLSLCDLGLRSMQLHRTWLGNERNMFSKLNN